MTENLSLWRGAEAPAASLSEWRSPEALAEALGVPVRTIYSWRARGKGPRAHKIGKHLRFRRADVEAWLATQADAA